MTFLSSLALFDHLMNGGGLDEAGLIEFLAQSTTDEGLHLDFKSGGALDQAARDRNFVIKQYVAAFANSEGGVLIVGVRDKTKVLDPITPSHEGKVGGDLAGWAARCVDSGMLGYLGTIPRFLVVDVLGGKVLLIAVGRAPTLVPVVREGRQAFYFRIEDEAREVYPHLIADLLLGRRQSPRLTVAIHGPQTARLADAPRTGDQFPGHVVIPTLNFIVQNESLVTANGIFVRLYAYAHHPSSPMASSFLDGFVEHQRVGIPAGFEPQQHQPLWRDKGDDQSRTTATLRRFDVASLQSQTWRLPLSRTAERTWLGALLLVPEGCPPQWFEVEVDIPVQLTDTSERPIAARVQAIATASRRPRIGPMSGDG